MKCIYIYTHTYMMINEKGNSWRGWDWISRRCGVPARLIRDIKDNYYIYAMKIVAICIKGTQEIENMCISQALTML